MAVDDALAAVFRTRFALKHHRKQKKGLINFMLRNISYVVLSVDEAKSILHFKLRVLDLVELYIRKESTNPLVLVDNVIILFLHPKHFPLFPPNFRTWWSLCMH